MLIFRDAHGANNIGRLAQLVERLVYTENVSSSSLLSPTIKCGCSSVVEHFVANENVVSSILITRSINTF